MLNDLDEAPVTHPVVTPFVGHTWMCDNSPFHTMGDSGDIWLGGVFEAHARTPLVLRTFEKKPDSNDMADLFKTATYRFGAPKYVITDKGPEFSGAFEEVVNQAECKLRHDAAGSHKATARLERFWRTLKRLIDYKVRYPPDISDLEQRLSTALAFYLHRPHKGLKGLTPMDVFLGLASKAVAAVRAPRGLRGEGPTHPPARIRFLEPGSHRLPVLVPAY